MFTIRFVDSISVSYIFVVLGCLSGFFDSNVVHGLRRAPPSPPRPPRSPISNRLGPAFHIEPPSKFLFSNDTGELSKGRNRKRMPSQPARSGDQRRRKALTLTWAKPLLGVGGIFLYCPNFFHSLTLRHAKLPT